MNILAFRERMTAIRASVSDIVNGKYGEENGPYVISPYGVELRRIALVGFITEQRSGEGKQGKYAYITIDDGTAAIKAWAWDIHVESLDKIEKSILALIIGKVKAFRDEVYIAPEIIRKLEDPNFITLHMLERYHILLSRGGSVEHDFTPPTDSILQESLDENSQSMGSTKPTSKLGNLIYEYVRENIGPDGIKIAEIVAHFLPLGYEKQKVNLEVLDLQEQGILQEIKVGQYTINDN